VSLDDLLERLHDDRSGVRRVAVLDLAKRVDGPDRARVLDALASRLGAGEPDEKAALAIIGVLDAAGHVPAREVLWRLYEDRTTPIRVAHAGVLAHDRLEGVA